MGGNSGGGGKPGRGGGGGPTGTPEEQLMNNLRIGKLSLADSEAAEKATYRASHDAFWAKDYDRAGELENKYKVMRDANAAFKVEQEAKNRKTDWSKVKTRNGPSVRDDDSAGGRRDLNSDFVKRMKNPKFR